MLGLRQKIGGDKCWIEGCFINHNHLQTVPAGKSTNVWVCFATNAFGFMTSKIAGTENLVYFWYCFSSGCHCRYRLCASGLIHLGYASQTCRHKDCEGWRGSLLSGGVRM